QCKSRLRQEVNKALWWKREGDIEQIERELFDWTTRLDLRLVGLPQELKTAIDFGLDDESKKAAPNFVASSTIQNLRHLSEKARLRMIDELWKELADVPENIQHAVRNGPLRDVSSFSLIPSHSGNLTFLVEKRPLLLPKSSSKWPDVKDELLRLASALNCLDGATVSLLQCNYLFYDGSTFCLVHSLPRGFQLGSGNSACATLKSLILKKQGNNRLPPMH